MSTVSEGVRRLSLVLGILGCAGMLLFVGAACWTEYVNAVSALERQIPAGGQEETEPSEIVKRAIERWREDAEERKRNALVEVIAYVPLSGAIGFLVPWGAIRISGWVVQGFVRDWKR